MGLRPSRKPFPGDPLATGRLVPSHGHGPRPDGRRRLHLFSVTLERAWRRGAGVQPGPAVGGIHELPLDCDGGGAMAAGADRSPRPRFSPLPPRWDACCCWPRSAPAPAPRPSGGGRASSRPSSSPRWPRRPGTWSREWTPSCSSSWCSPPSRSSSGGHERWRSLRRGRRGPGAGRAGGAAGWPSPGLLFALATMTRPEGVMIHGPRGPLRAVRAPRAARARPGGPRAPAGSLRPPGRGVLPHPLRPLHRLAGELLRLSRTQYFLREGGGPFPGWWRGGEHLGKLMERWPVWPLLVVAGLALLPIGERAAGPRLALALRHLARHLDVVRAGGRGLPRLLRPAHAHAGAPVRLPAGRRGHPKSRDGLAAQECRMADDVRGPRRLPSLHARSPVARARRPTGRPGESPPDVRRDLGVASRGELYAGPPRHTGIGVIPYETDWPTLDMFGLTDEHIAHDGHFDPAMPPAHARADPVYVLDQRPEFLISDVTPEGIQNIARLGWVGRGVGPRLPHRRPGQEKHQGRAGPGPPRDRGRRPAPRSLSSRL